MKNSNNKITFIIFVLILVSCSQMKTFYFLEKCHKKMEYQNGNFFPTNLAELKQKIQGKKPLFYVGSDSTSHYFVFYYDKLKKIVTGFKIPYYEYKPLMEIPFENDNYYLKKYVIYLNEI